MACWVVIRLWGEGVSVSHRVWARKRLDEEVAFEHRLEGGERGIHADR